MDHDYLDHTAGRRPGTAACRPDGPSPLARDAQRLSLASAAGNSAFGRLLSAGGAGRAAVLRSALRSQGAGRLDPEIGAAIEARRGAGSPLPEPVRAEMEGHLGADLSAVRVHTDGAAATLNRAVQAEAFTTGTDVFFAPGRYDTSSSAGRGLLAHELTHVVQQSSGAGGPGGTVSHPDDPAELEAAAVGAQVAREATPMPDEEEEVSEA